MSSRWIYRCVRLENRRSYCNNYVYMNYTVLYTFYVKVKVSHNRPRWPKGFRVS